MIPQGKTGFVWQLLQCAGGDPEALADLAVSMGFSTLIIKAADGVCHFNQGTTSWGGPNLLPGAITALRAHGIKVIGWQYIYGANSRGGSIAEAEADRANENIARFQLDAWIYNPESEYKRAGSDVWANTYLRRIRNANPLISLGLCSYRFPTLHPEFPWTAFLRPEFTDFHCPQVYWILANNPGQQLQRSYRELNAIRALPFFPVGCAYYDPGYGWQPTVAQLQEFETTARAMNLPGISFWEWGENFHGFQYIPAFWDAIKAMDWSIEPPLEWSHQMTEWAKDPRQPFPYTGIEP